MNAVAVGVVSDFPLVGAGLASLLRSYADVVEVVEEWRVDEPSRSVDIALVDVTGRRLDQLEAVLRSLLEHPSATTVAIYASGLPAGTLRLARRYGIRSFVSKGLSGAALVQAFTDTAAGRRVDTFTVTGGPAPGWPGRNDGLTERESQVLVLCAQGMTNREIADALFISLETVRTHMKGAYARLGLRNRAEATAYVHSLGDVATEQSARSSRLVPVAERSLFLRERVSGESRPTDDRPYTEQLGIDAAELDQRMSLMGLDAPARARLRAHRGLLLGRMSELSESLVRRWLGHDSTAALLPESSREQLVGFLRSYLHGVAQDEDLPRVEEVLQIGAAHHRMQIAPQWVVASFAHIVIDHAAAIVAASNDPDRAIDDVTTLLGTVLFDAALVLDAYEMCVEREILRDVEQPAAATATAETRVAMPVRRATTVTPRSLVKVALSSDEAQTRREFLGLTDHDLRVLEGLQPAFKAVVPDVLRSFYELVATTPSIRSLVNDDVVERLQVAVGAYWIDLVAERFDKAHAASRMRIGVIHERIGLAPQFYLAGLACQLRGLLRVLPRDPVQMTEAISALVRAVFFDVTFVLDAYMDARAASLLQIGRFAGQVVAGLANGIAIADARDRVEYANEQLLQLLGIPAGVLHRLPVDEALPLPGLLALVQRAREEPGGRATALHDAWGRRLRVTAIRLRQSAAGRSGLVALVLDDISDVIRASEEHDHESRRFEHVLASVNAVVWELDRTAFTVLAISSAALALTGQRDTDLLGRAAFVDLIDPRDRTRFLTSCAALAEGDRLQLDHRMRRRDGMVRRVRSAIVATSTPDGTRTISGVTVDVGPDDADDAGDEP